MKKNLHSFLLPVVLLMCSFSISAADKESAEKYVSKSLITLENFANDSTMGWFRSNIRNAKGIFIIPTNIEAAFVFGASGGTGVLLRHNDNDRWSYPAFYSTGSASFGFQAGAQASEVVMLVMTEKGMNALLSPKVQLGLDASIALGPIGAGAAVATVDILQFSRHKGLFGGVAAEGTLISPRNKVNHAYYSKELSPVDILVSGKGLNSQADPLRARLEGFKDFIVEFAFNETKINTSAKSELDYAAKALNANPRMTLGLEGYTDSVGDAEYNLKLSERRAQSVKAYLVSQGVDSARLTITSFGLTNPVSSNSTVSGQAANRRVVLKITNK
ncbi:MAG: OmpA family protein [Methyloprofundus sp.]|nr:OmpA family protein [Methyloprofundus sp.]